MRLILVVALLLPAALRSQPASPFTPVPEPASDKLEFNHMIEPFQSTDLDGLKWTNASFRGHVTLLGVWATFCPPCRAEHAELESLYQRATAGGGVIQILTITLDNDENVVRTYRDKRSLHFPIIAGLSPNPLPNGDAIPAWWLVNERGERTEVFRSWSLGRIFTEAEKLAKLTRP
jgi:cytochrome oxidase Cu insertion factor (SCO1/SenC/PrrC family)